MPDHASRRWALLLASLASFLTPFMSSSLNVALPVIGREFEMDAVSLSWVPTSFLLAAAVLLVPVGRLADLYGRKKMFTRGMALYVAASALATFSTTGSVLIAARILQGIAGAMTFGVAVAILTSVYPAEERGKALGISTASVYVGLSIGPFAGGYLTGQLGWRSIFLVAMLPGLLMLALIAVGLKGEWASAKREKLDLKGSLIYSIALIALMLGLSRLPDATAWALAGGGVLGMLLFVNVEERAESPVLDTRLFRSNRVFAFSNLAALINYSATFAVGFLLSLYLQYVRGMTPQEAGAILVAQPVVMAIGSPYAGRLSDRVEPRIVASWGMGLIVLGLLPFVVLGEATPIALIIAALVVLGMGFALFSSPNTNAVMSSVDRELYGVAAGALATMRMTGQMLSIGIAMFIFALFVGRVQVTPENTMRFLISVNVAFAVFAILCVAGVFASLARGRVR